MKVEAFFEKFAQLSDTPNAVAKMRELVLQLAVKGKLVDQNPADGDAGQLLRDIETARAARGRGKQYGVAYESQITEDDQWHKVPATWRWVRLGTVCDIAGGGTPRSDNATYFADEGIPWLTPADLNGYKEKRISRGRRCITPLGLANSSAQLLPAGSVLFSSRAPIGYVAIAGTALATNQGFKSCIPFVTETNEFLYYYLMSAAARVDREASGTTFREVSGKIVSQIPVPLPPLAEQKRIVAKVDELMTLCDQLEAQLQVRDTRHVALARASLARFAEAPTPANLDFLFHNSYTIAPADLRKSILTLAVQGKLVQQDPNDESATALLLTIYAERLVAINARLISPMKALPPVTVDELAYDPRPGWTLARLSELVMEIQTGPFGSSLHKSDYKLGGIPVINPASLKDGKIVPIDEMAIGPDTLKRLQVFQLTAGDIVMARRGEMGRCAVVTEREAGWLCGTGSLVLRMPNALYVPYLAMLIGSPEVREYLGGASVGTTMQNLNQSILARLPVGVPPLAEQRRIVAKVDQLTALVDQLEIQLTASRATAEKLMEAVVAELTASAPPSRTDSSVVHRMKPQERAHAG
jgi:type I restriction enzyme S subunit